MTLSTQYEPAVYVLDGLQTDFPLPWPVLASRDVLASRVVQYAQEPLAGYVVVGIGGESFATVRFTVPPEARGLLVLQRSTSLVQETDYPEGGKFPAKVTEKDFDRLVMIAQELDAALKSAIKVNPGAGITSDEMREAIFEAKDLAIQSAESAAEAEKKALISANTANCKAIEAATSAEAARQIAEQKAESATEKIIGVGRFGTLEEHTEGVLGVMAQPGYVMQMVQQAVPKGIISLWSGSIATIPQGWSLCDGTNGTPDLRNRFVMGAGDMYAVKQTGGHFSHNHGVTVNPTTLTAAQMPSHNHSVLVPITGPRACTATCSGLTDFVAYSTGAQGGGQSHTHTATSANTTVLPPFYALAYIMKL